MKWLPQRLLFTRLEIVFVTTSLSTQQTKVIHKDFVEA